MRRIHLLSLCAGALLAGCSGPTPKEQGTKEAAPSYFKVDPNTAGTLSGTIRFTGKKPARKPVDMSNDPACVEAHHGRPYDESLVVNSKGGLANVFIYVKTGLEDKKFATPA